MRKREGTNMEMKSSRTHCRYLQIPGRLLKKVPLWDLYIQAQLRGQTYL